MPRSRRCKARAAAVAGINADIAALEQAVTGGATDKATDRFLLDVDTAPISNLLRNRLIDHAGAAVTPIPAIAHGDDGCAS